MQLALFLLHLPLSACADVGGGSSATEILGNGRAIVFLGPVLLFLVYKEGHTTSVVYASNSLLVWDIAIVGQQLLA